MDWRQDKDYLDYIDSGESAAVYIVKNIVKSLDTKNMWVDVVSINTYYKRGSGNIAFNWIVVELFPRKIKPKYDTDPDYNRYLTWLTAHEDIEKQRDSGFHGEKFLVLCDLYDKNKNKFTTHTVIAKKYWEPMEAYRPMEIKNPVDPEWEYRVRAVKKVNAKQIRFAPGPKSVSVIRISKNNILCGASDMVSNVLDTYKKFHGKQIGILIRNGENLYVGWTDEEKVRIKDENVYLKPETREDSLEEAEVQSREEVASRYFVFSILQGVLNDGRILKVPEKINVLTPSPYLIFSMVDGWLEDNRYGTFADIVERTDAPLMKGDMILTTIKIERDDAGLGNIWNNGRSTRYDAWNNDRGRGERNRTHDAHIPDRRVVPVNLVDTIDTYTITEKKFRLTVTEVPVKVIREGNTTVTQFRYDTKKTNEYLGKITSYLTVKNNKLYEKIDVKGKSPEQILAAAKAYGYVHTDAEQITMDHTHSYYTVFESIVHTETEKEYYVSAKKDNYWKDTDSFANMEIRPGEYLNLTFLNSVYLVYAIQNHKIGGWRRGGMTVDYANSIPYLNKALEYIRKREKEEAVMIGRYMELYEGWQVDVSEWRLKNNYHRLTDARAGKFAKEKAGKIPAQKEKKCI